MSASRSTFGKYVLLRKLASGGMGEIFLAKQRGPSGFEKLLVIKRILSHHLDKRDYLDMFFSEAKLVARLNHNNIIQIHEMGEIDGDYYIAMEYVRGKSLRDLIDELRAEGRMMPLPHAIELAIKLCEGLGYAHQARDIRGRPMHIVHRDINPHNILVSYTGDLKLIDFGIAKSEMTSVHTATGTIKGKFVYMSPEQSAADPIDRRSDIFSLGIVIHEMTCLENPFVRQNVVLSLEAIQRQSVPAPSSRRPDAAPLDRILARALAKNPDERYQTAIDMRDDLRGLFRDGSVSPPLEDVSTFLHELFAADIEEEDRLLAEADQATAEPEEVPIPVPSLVPPLASHSSASVHATTDTPFVDEEPTLAEDEDLIAAKSRDASLRERALVPIAMSAGGSTVAGGGEGAAILDRPWSIDQPPRTVETPAPRSIADQPLLVDGPVSVAPDPTAFTSEVPTRSDRLPRSRPSGKNGHSAFGLARSPAEPASAALGALLPRGILEEGDDLRSSKPPALALTTGLPSMNAGGAASLALVAPALGSSASTDEESVRRSAPHVVGRWKILGRAAAYFAIVLVTTVAGFVGTRALIGGRPQLRVAVAPPDFPMGYETVEPAPAPDPDGIPGMVALSDGLDREVDSETREETENDRSESPTAQRRSLRGVPVTSDSPRRSRTARGRPIGRPHATMPAGAGGDEAGAEGDVFIDRAQLDDPDSGDAQDDDTGESASPPSRRAHVVHRPEDTPLRRSRPSRDQASRGPSAIPLEGMEEDLSSATANSMEATSPEAAEGSDVAEDSEASRSAPSGGSAVEESSRSAVSKESDRPEAAVSIEGGETPKDREISRTAASRRSSASRPGWLGALSISLTPPAEVALDRGTLKGTPTSFVLRRPSGLLTIPNALGPDSSVTLAYEVRESGLSVTVQAAPWAVVKHNGLSLGRTPQGPVNARLQHRFTLLRPGQVDPVGISIVWEPVGS